MRPSFKDYKHGCLIAALLLAPFLLFAQKIVYVDTAFSIFVPKTIFGEIDVHTCTDSLTEEELVMQYSYDVLMYPDGEMYGYGPLNGFIFDTVFFHSQDEPSTIYLPPQSTTISQDTRGLTCDENGFVYLAGRGISKRNTLCCEEQLLFCCDSWEEIYIGTLPPNMQCLGDITYRKGKFYLSAIGNKLVEVNMKDISKSQIIYEFPLGTLPIEGLTTVQVGCDSVVTYAIGRAWNHSIIYELDFNNWVLTQICDMPELAIEGAANKTECALPPCELFVDLDSDNSSFAYWGNYCSDTFCVPPIAVTDTDVVILSMANTLDSILLELTSIQNGVSEYLETNQVPSSLALIGNGTPNLLFLNNGTATLMDFEDALKSVVYQNNAVPLTYGMRHVRVTGWSGGVASIVSTADLPLSNNVLNLMPTVLMPTCHSLQDGSLSVEVAGGTAPYSFNWDNGETDSLLTSIGAGTYTVTVMDSEGCIKEENLQLLEPDTLLVTISSNGLDVICDESGLLTGSATGGTTPYTFNWDNGVVGINNDDLSAGDYQLTVLDSNGCQSQASYTLLMGETIMVNETAAICQGASYDWNGSMLQSDTMVCHMFQLPGGCDSTICLQLTVNPSPNVQISSLGTLCKGASVSLSVGQFSSYQWSTMESSQTIAVNTPGNYSVTVTNTYGCTASNSILLTPGIGFNYSVNQPTCFGLEDGSIIFGMVSGGVPPYEFSLDSLHFSPSNEFLNLPGGQYWPTVQDADGCRVVESVILDSPQEIIVNAGADQTTELGVPVILSATTNVPNLIFQWQPTDFLDCTTCQSVNASPTGSIAYSITAADAHGCVSSDTVNVFVNDVRKFFIPTAFSPNGDGINDGFTVYSDAAIDKIASFEIFDRWGELIFITQNITTNDPSQGWNGTFNGRSIQAGTFVYVVKLIWADDTEQTIKGEINLVR